MAKAKSKEGLGKGWHKQPIRHRNARLYGFAGGTYKTQPTRIIKTKLNKQTIQKAKNNLEKDLLRAIQKTKNPEKKAILQHLYKELRKADTHTKIQRYIKEYGYALSTLGMSIPFTLISPLILAGIILGTGLTKEIPMKTILPRIAMPFTTTVIGAEATKHSIKTMKKIHEEKEKIKKKTMKKLEQTTKLPKKDIENIAERIAEQEISQKTITHTII